MATRNGKARARASDAREYVYRGKTIRVTRGKTAAASKLTIDDREVVFEEDEHGVRSHEAMYMVFGSPFELAEELVRQWGTAEIKHGRHNPKKR